MAQAYDFALDKIGMEIMSYQVRAPEKFCSTAFCLDHCRLTSLLPSPSARFGWTTSTFSKECKCCFGFSLQGLTKAPHPDDCSCHSSLCREAVGSYAENQRITAVRRVYQRGCVNPMINIEQLWRDYSKYEEASELPRSGFHCLICERLSC